MSGWPKAARAGSRNRAGPLMVELARPIEPARTPSSWLDRIELARASSQLDAPSWLEAVRAGSESRAGSPLVELAQPLELARPESSWLDQIELARWGSSWLDGSSQLDPHRAGSMGRASSMREPARSDQASSMGVELARWVEPARCASQLDPIEPARLRVGRLCLGSQKW